MKTLTEFVAVTLRTAGKTRAELTAGGKTVEELPPAMGEALKLEGDKLTFMMNALEAVGDKTEDLKRVIVFTLSEGEKAPNHAKQMGEHYYVVEYYPSLTPKKSRGDSRDDRGGFGGRGGRDGKGRGDKRGGKRGEGRGGDSRGENRGPREDRPANAGGRPPRGPRPPRAPAGITNPDGTVTVNVSAMEGKPAGDRRPRRERPPRQERPQGRSGLTLPKPKSMAGDAASAAPASTETQAPSETSSCEPSSS
jgi:hypothetical protein